VLAWADELAASAENVIVIPKYDCLDKIPARFVLGYSVPTTHGGTQLPPSAFKGRRVHLLGGSWKSQLEYLRVMGDDVVSVDNNYISRIADWAHFTYPDGRDGNLTDIGLSELVNPKFVSIAISLGNIAAAVNALYAARSAQKRVDAQASDTSQETKRKVKTRGHRTRAHSKTEE